MLEIFYAPTKWCKLSNVKSTFLLCNISFFSLVISVSSSLICPGFLQVLSSVYFSVTCQDINYPWTEQSDQTQVSPRSTSQTDLVVGVG